MALAWMWRRSLPGIWRASPVCDLVRCRRFCRLIWRARSPLVGPEVEPSRRRHNTASARTPTPAAIPVIARPLSLLTAPVDLIPLSLASIALAYGDKALSHNNDPAFRSLDIAFEEMIKILMT